MKKIALLGLVLLFVIAMTAPVHALSLSTWNLEATSGAFVASGSIGNGGSFAFAANGSLAQVKFSSDPKVTTVATSSGLTITHGFAIAGQTGSALAHGTLSGFHVGW